MGLCVSCYADWKVAPNGSQILDFTDTNNFMLESYANFIGPYTTKNPSVSALLFNEPIVWHSYLTPGGLRNFSDL